jgi:hypothetical protein|tara:strand:+ start:3959 stop:4099 length:141 start_codon:yes stop_codon:yes gene_type:complete
MGKEKKDIKLKQVTLTFQEWKDSLRVPMPHKSKKHYTRKEKHKGKI